jgi:hypothetical protein
VVAVGGGGPDEDGWLNELVCKESSPAFV